MMLDLESLCITCFQEPDVQFLRIQGEQNRSVADVLKKHFWFTDNDLQPAMICQSCWNHVQNFDKFYSSVEELHHTRSAALLVQIEPNLDTIHVEPVDVKVNVEELQAHVRKNHNPQRTERLFLQSRARELVMIANKNELVSTMVKSEPEVQETQPEPTASPIQNENISQDDSQLIEENSIQVIDDNSAEPVPDVAQTFAKYKKEWFRTPKSLEQHRKDDQYIRNHVKCICKQCGIESTTFSLFLRHAQEIHSNSSAYLTCCRKKFFRKSRLLEHVLAVNNPDVFRCPQCLKKLVTKSALKKHTKMFHGMIQQKGPEQSPEQCQTSDGNELVSVIVKSEPRLDDQLVLPAAEITVKSEPVETFDIANENVERSVDNKERVEDHHESEFVQSEDDDQHDPDVALGTATMNRLYAERQKRLELSQDIDEYIKPHVKYLCEQCGLESVSFSNYLKHAQEAHGNKKAYVSCCGKKFYKRVRLLEHVQFVNNPSLFRCNRCEKNFNSKLGFLVHVKQSTCANTKSDPDDAQDILMSMITDPQQQDCWRHSQSIDEHIRQHVKYLCEHCGLESESFARFIQHIQETHAIKNAYLMCCGKKYNTRIRLLDHVQFVNNPKIFRCEPCDMNFDRRLGLRNHAYQFHTGNAAKDNAMMKIYGKRLKHLKQIRSEEEVIKRHVKYLCAECGLECETLFELLKHSRVFHKNNSPFLRCCGKKFVRRNVLLDHVRAINNPEMIRCGQCDETFTKIGLRRHTKKFHTVKDENSAVVPDVPNTKQKSERQKRLDIEEELIRRHVKYLCKQCGLESETFALFLNHAVEVHGSKSPYLACCGRRFRSRVRLLEHVQLVNNPDLFNCDLCAKKFNQKIGLIVHTKEFHNGSMEALRKLEDDYIKEHVQYNCQICGHESPSFILFRKHSIEVHDNYSGFIMCCGKKYTRRLELLTHVLTLNNSNPFRCDSCKHNFSTALELQTHTKECRERNTIVYTNTKSMKRVEGLVKNSCVCKECGEEYPTRQSLNDHMKLQKHTEQFKTNYCSICSIGFRSKSWFSKHMQKHKRAGNV